MHRIAPLPALVIVGLHAAGVVSCSSDEVRHLDEGGAPDGSAGAPGAGGATPSSGGTSGGTASGGSATGGRAAGGSAMGGQAGAAGRAGAAGASSTGGRGGQGGSGVGGAAACAYAGAQHPSGSTFRSSDGCNTCSCNAGVVACTKRACIEDAGTDAAGMCTDAPPAKICIRGPMVTSSGEPLKVGDKVTVQVQPRGCFSSSCTVVHTATCTVTNPMQHVVTAHFCLEGTGAGACTADCNGGGIASCSPSGGLAQGQHTFMLGGLSITFSVPGVLPTGGECIGSPF